MKYFRELQGVLFIIICCTQGKNDAIKGTLSNYLSKILLHYDANFWTPPSPLLSDMAKVLIAIPIYGWFQDNAIIATRLLGTPYPLPFSRS